MASHPEVGVNFATFESVRDIIRLMPKEEWKTAKDKCPHCIVKDLSDDQKKVCINHIHELVR